MARLRTRIIVVGDIHGRIEPLQSLVDNLAPFDRPIVFLGDYVNRSHESRQVLDTLLALQRNAEHGAEFLLGNHDHALLKFLNRELDFASFALMGGAQTIRSYLSGSITPDAIERFITMFPQEHRQFLEALRTHWEDDSVLVAHAGPDLANPDDRSLAVMALQSHPELFSASARMPKDLVVVGHYIQSAGRPYLSDQLICLDTGCGTQPDGHLTALLLPERDTVSFPSPRGHHEP